MGAPGTLWWLITADLRLAARTLGSAVGGRPGVRATILILLAFGALMVMVRPVGRWIAQAASDPAQAEALDGAMVLGTLIVMPWVASHALTGATRALYSRGDLDLLLTAPLPPSRILAARALAIVVEATTAVGVFLLPLILSAVWYAGPKWIALAPTLAGVGLVGAAFGITIALCLFAALGPRRTRQVAQAVAMLLGVSFVALLQALNFVPEEFDATLASLARTGESAALSTLLLTPARAAQGDLLRILATLAVGFAVLSLVCALLGRFFVSAALRAAGAPTPVPAAAPWSRPVFSRSAASAMRAKEWKLLSRDPWLVGHLLMQAIYTLPIAGAIWRLKPVDEAATFITGTAAVMIMAQLSAALAWIAVSSEEAGDLMASAPVAVADQQRRKLEALAAPLLALLAPVILWLAWTSLYHAAVVALFALAAAASTALINIWRPQPGKRSAMARRYSQAKTVALMEHLIAILWGMATLLLLEEKSSWIWLVALALLALWLARPAKSPRESGLAKSARAH